MATPDARTRWGTIAVLLGMASCLGGDDGAGGGGSFDEAASAVTVCRELSLHAEYTPSHVKTDDQELPTPSVLARVPATLEATNPDPDLRAVLWFQLGAGPGMHAIGA